MVSFRQDGDGELQEEDGRVVQGSERLKKAYDMVPHSWLLECLSVVKTAGNIRKLLEKSMKWEIHTHKLGPNC